jgi:hypothetical protein
MLSRVIFTVYSIIWPHLGADTWADPTTITTTAAAAATTANNYDSGKNRTKGQEESLGQLLEYVILFFWDEMFIQTVESSTRGFTLF